jgi:cephalosporin-C deacetylase
MIFPSHLHFFKKSCRVYTKILGTVAFIFSIQVSSAQITITPDKLNCFYSTTDTARFSIYSTWGGATQYKIQRDPNINILDSATLTMAAGETRVVSYKTTEPSFIYMTAKDNNAQYARIGVAFSAYDIKPFEPDPADFDAFWGRQKKILSQIPLDAQVVPLAVQPSLYSTTYSLSLATINNRRVYGFVTIPIGAGPFPAVLTLPPFGTVANLAVPELEVAEKTSAISVSLVLHNTPVEVEDPLAYMPNDPSSREGNYYRLAVIAGYRAIDYIFSRPDFDGQNVVVNGASQGAGLTVLLAGTDNRVKMITGSNPALAEHTGLRYNHTSPFPFFYKSSINANDSRTITEKILFNTKYIDAVRAAKRMKGPVLMCVSYVDDVCPPETTMSTFNQFTGLRVLVHCLNYGHSHPNEYWNGRFDFWRRANLAYANTVLPYRSAVVLGNYYASAGNDTILPVGVRTMSLGAYIEHNDVVNTSFAVNWKKTSGDGHIAFSQPNSRQTTAVFEKAGTYIVSIYADDESLYAIEKKRITVAHSIKVVVR